MMKISRDEQEAICTVVTAGDAFGYGNLISHLQTRWAKKLMTSGLTEEAARAASGGDGYPFEMQVDLIMKGEWDETGQRYVPKP